MTMRLQAPKDKESHYAWFIDPNLGLVCFEDNHTFEEAQNLFNEFLVDWFSLRYPDIYSIESKMLIK